MHVIDVPVVADFADVVDSVVDFAVVVEAFVVHVSVGLWSYWPNSGLRNLASFGYDALEGQSFLEIVGVGIWIEVTSAGIEAYFVLKRKIIFSTKSTQVDFLSQVEFNLPVGD